VLKRLFMDRLLRTLLFGFCWMAFLTATPAKANTITVMNNNDSGSGSLRAAIASAVSGDTIVFASGVTGVITLTSGELDISTDLTITGPGVKVLAISGNHASRVFSLSAATVSISKLTITGGYFVNYPYENIGGAIYNDGTMTLTACTLSDNQAAPAVTDSGFGGAIGNDGTMTLIACTLTGNSALFGGAIFNGGRLTLTNCTLSGNSALFGGAIATYVYYPVMLTSCTISSNTAYYGGGLDVDSTSGTPYT
jgi:hypothetical protein